MPSPLAQPVDIIPHLIVRGGTAAIAFYQTAFGAELVYELKQPDNVLAHAEMTLGGARFMLADEFPEFDCISPQGRGGTTVHLSFYVPDVDAAAARAVAAGAVLERPVVDEFYGDRVAQLRDPFGHRWSLHTRIEDVSPQEMQRRMTSS